MRPLGSNILPSPRARMGFRWAQVVRDGGLSPRTLARTITNTMAKRRGQTKATQSRASNPQLRVRKSQKPKKRPQRAAGAISAHKRGKSAFPCHAQSRKTQRRPPSRRPTEWRSPIGLGQFPSAAAWKACGNFLGRDYKEICRSGPNCFRLVHIIACSGLMHGYEAEVNWYTGGNCIVTMPTAVAEATPGVYLVKRKITRLFMHDEDLCATPAGSMTHLRRLGSSAEFIQMAFVQSDKLGSFRYDKLMDMLSIPSCAADHESLWTADNSESDEANCGSSTECGCGSGETRSRCLGHQASCS
jgi:hypothetical protein